MKTKGGHEWFTVSLKFDIAARDQAAAKTKGLRISRELVGRYDLNSEPTLKVQPAREVVAA